MAIAKEYEELLKKWRSLVSEEGDGSMTVREIVAQTHRSDNWVRRQIGQAIADGKMTSCCRRVTRIDGRPGEVPAYRVVATKRPGKNARSHCA